MPQYYVAGANVQRRLPRETKYAKKERRPNNKTEREVMPLENEEKQRGTHLCCHQAHRARWKREDGTPQHGTGAPWFVVLHETCAGYTGGRRWKQNHKDEHSSYCRKAEQSGHKFKIKAIMKIAEKRTYAIL